MSATVKSWLISAGNAAISGAATAIAAGMVGVNFKKSLAIAGVSAVISLAKWIAQHPLPGADAQ